ALVSPSSLGTPRRAVVGWDSNRLAMVLAVLETRAGIAIGAHDVYLNVAGGVRVREPGADLAVAAALVSSLSGIALPAEAVFFGEVALSGAVRPIGQSELRLKEAAKLGLTRAVIADGAEASRIKGVDIKALDDLSSLAAWITAG
ncbi:MAG: DNA repair protein RadA, partial [Hyphomicrobiales bacterium]|nr:DNA repair protein RadA [Hyphomicrobiales bacterium]